MTYRVLAIKWRPTNFDQVIGQEHITKALNNAIKNNRVSHAFTFSGPRGVGKTSTARILAKELNGVENLDSSFDIIEMDAASNRGIDEIRSLRENVMIAPAHGKYKIYIIDEVHMLTKEAFNALLKTLEEPPPNVVFILATTDPYKMPATILSRTQRYDFRRLSINNIIQQLEIILTAENINFDEISLKLIARKADGSMRDALGFLDQVLNFSEENIDKVNVQQSLGIVNDETYIKLLDSIYKGKVDDVISLINNSLDAGTSIHDFIVDFNIFLRNVLYSMVDFGNNEVDVIANWIVENNKVSMMEIVRLMDILLQFEIKTKLSDQSNLALEVLMIKLCNLDSIVNITSFLGKNKNKFTEIKAKQNKTKVNNDKPIIKNVTIVKEDSNSNKDLKVSKKPVLIDDSKQKAQLEYSKSDITDKLIDIISLIEKNNSKTAGFMTDVLIEKVDNINIEIKVNNISEFMYEALKKDITIIKDAFNTILNTNHNIKIYKGKELDVDSNKKKKNKKDKDHPLFMNIIEKFEGQVIK